MATNFIPDDIARLEPLGPNDGDIEGIERKCRGSSLQSPLLNFLGKTLLKRGYARRAQFVFERLLELDPKRWHALEFLARCQLALGRKGDAINTLTKLLGRNDVARGTVEWARDQIEAISRGSIEQPSAEPATADISDMNEALIDVLEKRNIVTYMGPANAAQLERVEAQLRRQPDDRDLLEWYAFLLYSNRRVPESIDVYERLVAEFEPTDTTLYYLGSAHLKLFNIRSARSAWDSLKERFSDSTFVERIDGKLRRLGELGDTEPRRAGRRNPIKGLLNKIQQALDKMPSPAVQMQVQTDSRPVVTEMTESDETVLADVEALLQNDPDNPDFLDWAAFIHYCNGSFPQAQQYYERVLASGTETPYAYYYLGAIYYRTGQDPEAVAYWQQLVTKFPDHTLCRKASEKLAALACGGNVDVE